MKPESVKGLLCLCRALPEVEIKPGCDLEGCHGREFSRHPIPELTPYPEITKNKGDGPGMSHAEMSRWGVACAAPVGHDLLVAGTRAICTSPAGRLHTLHNIIVNTVPKASRSDSGPRLEIK